MDREHEWDRLAVRCSLCGLWLQEYESSWSPCKGTFNPPTHISTELSTYDFGPRMYTLDENRNPVRICDVLDWGMAMQSVCRQVRDTQLGIYRVSTVFLGLDHNLFPNRNMMSPVLWETMVFGEDGSEDYQERYTSEAEAREGHARAVQWVKDTLLPRDDVNCGEGDNDESV